MEQKNQAADSFDLLEMNNYKIEKLPKMQKSGFERLLQRLGIPLALAAFGLIYGLGHFPFIDRLDPSTLTGRRPNGSPRWVRRGSSASTTPCWPFSRRRLFSGQRRRFPTT